VKTKVIYFYVTIEKNVKNWYKYNRKNRKEKHLR